MPVISAVLRCGHLGVMIVWFARNFEGRYAVRSVLIASVVGLAINIVINVGDDAGMAQRQSVGSTGACAAYARGLCELAASV